MTMRRIVLLVGLVALTPALAGCTNFDMDKLDIFGLNEKKKLPGDRKPLFPEGVPGVSQGVPPEYIKGNQPPPDTAQAPSAEPDKAATAAEPAKKTATVEPADAPKPKPKRKPKPRTAAQPAQNQQQVPQQQQSQQAPSPWPAQQQSTGTAPWPSAPPPGTFSR
jgi:hypothetical protein